MSVRKPINRKKYPDLLLERDGYSIRAERSYPWRYGDRSEKEFAMSFRSRYDVYVDGVLRAYIVFPSGAFTHWELLSLGDTTGHTYLCYRGVDLTKHSQKLSRLNAKMTAELVLAMVPDFLKEPGKLPSDDEISEFRQKEEARKAREREEGARQHEQWRIENLAKSKTKVVETTERIAAWKSILEKSRALLSNFEVDLLVSQIRTTEWQLGNDTYHRDHLIERDNEIRAARGEEKT